MIVKVMKPNDQTGSEYCMWDGIDFIEVDNISDSHENDSSKGPSARLFRVVGSLFEDDCPSKGKSINFQDKHGDWCSILFNTIAYICGNDGKTVEIVRG